SEEWQDLTSSSVARMRGRIGSLPATSSGRSAHRGSPPSHTGHMVLLPTGCPTGSKGTRRCFQDIAFTRLREQEPPHRDERGNTMKYFTPELYVALQQCDSPAAARAVNARWEKAVQQYQYSLIQLRESNAEQTSEGQRQIRALHRLLNFGSLHDAE